MAILHRSRKGSSGYRRAISMAFHSRISVCWLVSGSDHDFFEWWDSMPWPHIPIGCLGRFACFPLLRTIKNSNSKSLSSFPCTSTSLSGPFSFLISASVSQPFIHSGCLSRHFFPPHNSPTPVAFHHRTTTTKNDHNNQHNINFNITFVMGLLSSLDAATRWGKWKYFLWYLAFCFPFSPFFLFDSSSFTC